MIQMMSDYEEYEMSTSTCGMHFCILRYRKEGLLFLNERCYEMKINTQYCLCKANQLNRSRYSNHSSSKPAHFEPILIDTDHQTTASLSGYWLQINYEQYSFCLMRKSLQIITKNRDRLIRSLSTFFHS